MQQTFVVLHEGITKPREKARQIKDAKKRAATGELVLAMELVLDSDWSSDLVQRTREDRVEE